MNCYVCGDSTREAFSLGDIYVSNFIPKESSSESYPKSDLTMMVCNKCGTGQLKNTINPDLLYKEKYWYYSGINKTMISHLRDLVDKTVNSIKYEKDDIWVDIASNDGSLLRQVPDELTTIGIDPADEDIMSIARQRADHIVNDYFSEEAFRSVCPSRQAKVITCAAMFYDLKDPHTFLDDVWNSLANDGIFVVQLSYTPLMLKQLEFSNIVQEHVCYYDFYGMTELLEKHKFRIVDVELNDTNGGSFRIFCTKGGIEHFRTPQERDVAEIRIKSLYNYEYATIQSPFQQYKDFFDKINLLKEQTVDFIVKAKEQGKTVMGLAASTKGNTLLQYFDINNTLIDKIADRNSVKWGLKTIGSEIPICSEQKMRAAQPDYLLVLAWAFVKEMAEREKDYLKKGGKFIIPSPKFAILGENGYEGGYTN